jgi:hypothetical protein
MKCYIINYLVKIVLEIIGGDPCVEGLLGVCQLSNRFIDNNELGRLENIPDEIVDVIGRGLGGNPFELKNSTFRYDCVEG